MAVIKDTLHGALKGVGNTFVQCVNRIVQIYHDDTGWYDFNGKRALVLTGAVTANVTTTTQPAGTMAVTTHATGQGLLFFSDGTHWQVSTAAVPVKATGAELDTGTDDAKFATAKALADSGFINKTGIAALTDNSGGAAADGTIGAVTAPSAVTDSSGGTPSTTLAVQTLPTSPGVGADGTTPSGAQWTAAVTQLTVLKNVTASMAARQGEDRTAIIALTDAVKELATKVNALIAE